jgi:hypothetical protein
MSKSLLKISFARRVDHSKSRTLCCFGFRSATIGGNRGSEPLLHALCARCRATPGTRMGEVADSVTIVDDSSGW